MASRSAKAVERDSRDEPRSDIPHRPRSVFSLSFRSVSTTDSRRRNRRETRSVARGSVHLATLRLPASRSGSSHRVHVSSIADGLVIGAAPRGAAGGLGWDICRGGRSTLLDLPQPWQQFDDTVVTRERTPWSRTVRIEGPPPLYDCAALLMVAITLVVSNWFLLLTADWSLFCCRQNAHGGRELLAALATPIDVMQSGPAAFSRTSDDRSDSSHPRAEFIRCVAIRLWRSGFPIAFRRRGLVLDASATQDARQRVVPFMARVLE